MTTITLTPDLETALAERAKTQGTTTELLALDALREKFSRKSHLHSTEKRAEEVSDEELHPRNAWEALVLSMGFDAGVSLTDEQVSREVIYEDHD